MTPLAERPELSDEGDVGSGEGGEEEEEDEDDDEIAWPELTPPGCFDPAELPKGMLMGTCVLENRMLVPLLVSPFTPLSLTPFAGGTRRKLISSIVSTQFSSSWHDSNKQVEIRELLAATGESVAGKLAIWVG